MGDRSRSLVCDDRCDARDVLCLVDQAHDLACAGDACGEVLFLDRRSKDVVLVPGGMLIGGV